MSNEPMRGHLQSYVDRLVSGDIAPDGLSTTGKSGQIPGYQIVSYSGRPSQDGGLVLDKRAKWRSMTAAENYIKMHQMVYGLLSENYAALGADELDQLVDKHTAIVKDFFPSRLTPVGDLDSKIESLADLVVEYNREVARFRGVHEGNYVGEFLDDRIPTSTLHWMGHQDRIAAAKGGLFLIPIREHHLAFTRDYVLQDDVPEDLDLSDGLAEAIRKYLGENAK